jgi:hypothetical protein
VSKQTKLFFTSEAYNLMGRDRKKNLVKSITHEMVIGARQKNTRGYNRSTNYFGLILNRIVGIQPRALCLLGKCFIT